MLTALANGLNIISTNIGIENIPIEGLNNVKVANNMNTFTDEMIYFNQLKYSKIDLIKIKKFRKLIMDEFYEIMNCIIYKK